MSEKTTKGYQFLWFRYHWEGAELLEDMSDWELCPFIFPTKHEAECEAMYYARERDTQTRILFFDGEDWQDQQQPPPSPDFEREKNRFGAWISHAAS